VPLFCRHNRFEASCPICSRQQTPAQRTRSPAARSRTATGQRRPAGLVTRKLSRATDDGYRNALVPGLKATADAERLAGALALAAQDLAARPQLTLAEAAELAFGDAGAIAGWTPPTDGPGWTPERRFDRWFDRLRLPHTTRAQRFAFLVALGPSHDLEADSLHFDTKGDDATTLAAKRALNSGDALLLERRARALATAAGLPVAALDRGLALWDGTEPVAPEPRHDGARAALRLA
jgi:hypothetical protein